MTASSFALQTQLNQETDLARQLNDLLLDEEKALLSNDPDPLLALTQTKSDLVQKLSQANQERYRCLDSLNCMASDQGMVHYLREHPNETLQSCWDRFLQVVKAAKERNRTNGMLLMRLYTRNQSALQALRGGHEAKSLYEPNGQQKQLLSFRSTSG